MWIAKQDFNSMIQGPKKKGDEVEFNATFEREGLIEKATETKPLIAGKVETKPNKPSKKGKK